MRLLSRLQPRPQSHILQKASPGIPGFPLEVVADQDLGKGRKITRQEELRNKSRHHQLNIWGKILDALVVSTS
ncbi:Uncharacterized protein HZ326_26006 [Fusarium oxysporum f. sp. albedinis]|nr:Uncharacterized protein HZ326_26006 [Fusarium oxysporum f. sp. albedinis]